MWFSLISSANVIFRVHRCGVYVCLCEFICTVCAGAMEAKRVSEPVETEVQKALCYRMGARVLSKDRKHS